jgi:hypothetical protein
MINIGDMDNCVFNLACLHAAGSGLLAILKHVLNKVYVAVDAVLDFNY